MPRLSEFTAQDMRVDDLFNFARERYSIQLKKEAGEPKPWTQDPVLQKYRFCCVYREDDKESRWITRNWIEPHADDPDLWFAMVVARHFNNGPCLEELGYPVPWNLDHYTRELFGRRANGDRLFNGAYMVSTNGKSMDKVLYLRDHVFAPLWHNREMLRPKPGDTCAGYHVILGQFHGLGSFMAAQVVADLKNVSPLKEASDFWTFAASGPGSRRGMNRMLRRPVNDNWREDDWRLAMGRLHPAMAERFETAGMPRLSAQNTQNLLCEFDKLIRAREDGGRPKQRYPGAA